MRIALYHNLPYGGARRFVHELLRRSAETHEYHVFRVVGDPTSIPSEPDAYGAVQVYDVLRRPIWREVSDHLKIARMPAELASLWQAEREVAERIDADAYDFGLVHPCGVTQSPSLLYRLKTPTLYFAQETRRIGLEWPLQQYWRSQQQLAKNVVGYPFELALRWSDRRAFHAATHVATNSAFTAESIYRSYGRTSTVVPLGVDMEAFRPTGSPNGNFVISVGALDATKGHHKIVRALGLLPVGSRPDLRVVYERAAPGHQDLLSELASAHGVTLHLHQGVSDAELAALYSTARATVCAARLEPFGLTPLESLSCGTPVVAINEGGFRESVSSGYNGLLVPPILEGIAGGIARVLGGEITTNPADIRESVRSRTWDQTVDALHSVYGVFATRA